jgi:hypothetical protein
VLKRTDRRSRYNHEDQHEETEITQEGQTETTTQDEEVVKKAGFDDTLAGSCAALT